MATITIPKKITEQGELIVIPRREYDEFLRYKLRTFEEVGLTLSQKKAISAARKRISRGNFLTINELKSKLGVKN